MKEFNLICFIHTVNTKSILKSEEILIGKEKYINAISKSGTTTGKINLNGTSKIYYFAEFKETFESIFNDTGITVEDIIRADLAFDSENSNHYEQYKKLYRCLLMCLACTYKTKNNYISSDLFSLEQLTIAVKNDYFQCEIYDKEAQCRRKNIKNEKTKSRLELRSLSKSISHSNIEREFSIEWIRRLNRAVSSYKETYLTINDNLEKKYLDGLKNGLFEYRNLTDFILRHRETIFCFDQMVDFLSRFSEIEDSVDKASYYIKKYKVEAVTKNDLFKATKEIKRAMEVYFNHREAC